MTNAAIGRVSTEERVAIRSLLILAIARPAFSARDAKSTATIAPAILANMASASTATTHSGVNVTLDTRASYATGRSTNATARLANTEEDAKI